MITFFSALALAANLAYCAPTPENILLARKYAPQWRFTSNELYYPSTVDYFLPYVKAVDGDGNAVAQPSPLTSSNLADVANGGSGTYLAVPNIDAGKTSYLRGQNPARPGPVTYTFIAPKDNGIVDLYYWLFYPFNEAKNVPVVGQVGDHVGDWERMTVRTVNGVATQADYHAHSDVGSTLPWAQVPKFNGLDRPIGYVAKGSHGVWSSVGTHVYVNAVIFQLSDVTADGGLYWDTQDSLVTINYPETYTGDLSWLNFKGVWGNEGTTSCWYYFIAKECALIDGPGGPLRDDVLGAKRSLGIFTKFRTMDGPLSQILAIPGAGKESEYTFYVVAKPALAKENGYTRVAVEQRCHTVTPKDDGKDEISVTKRQTFTLLDQNKTKEAYRVTVDACEDPAFVHSYAVALCTSEELGSCEWSAPRVIAAYTVDTVGAQKTTSVVVEDLDNFYWE